MINLREYQKKAVDAGMEFFKHGKKDDRPIIIAPTGAGKSIIVGHLAHHLEGGVLVLQPSKELLEQNYAKYKAYGGEASVYSASMGMKNKGRVTFATIGSVKGKANEFGFVRHVIIDECHLVPPKKDRINKKGKFIKGSVYTAFLRDMYDVKILGLTATAFRLKSYVDPFTSAKYSQINLLNRERPSFFNKFLHITQIKELYEQGFLSPIKYIEMEWDNGQLKYNSTGAEFSDTSMDMEIKRQRVYEKIPSLIQQSIDKGRKHRLVFVGSIAGAMSMAEKIPDSACIHSGTQKKEREKILKDFKSGKIKTVFNVGVLTVGFDFPELDTIIIARPTMSLTLYMQILGRGIRKHEKKTDCAVVDMCGNIKRFGKIEEIIYTKDHDGKWIIRDDRKILSGVRIGV